MSNALAMHQASSDLANMHDRFNALAQVAGREMPKYLKTGYMPAISIASGTVAAAAQARYGTKGAIGNGVAALAAWVTAMLAGDNADLRNGAVAFASGVGAASAGILAYDKVTTLMASTTAPAASGAALPAAA